MGPIPALAGSIWHRIETTHDGIVFHPILQLHNMLTGRLPKRSIANVEINMLWDGLFHSFTWIMTVIAVILLFRARYVPHLLWSGQVFLGACFLGCGQFNFVEGLIDHHLLHPHHVVEQRGESLFDFLFLLSGILFMAGGGYAIRSARLRLSKP